MTDSSNESKKSKFSNKWKNKLSNIKNEVNDKIDSNEKLSKYKTQVTEKIDKQKEKYGNKKEANSEDEKKSDEKLSNLKHQMSGKLDNSKKKYSTMKSNMNEKKESKLHVMKHSMKRKVNSFKNRFEMQGLLKQARKSFEQWLIKLSESNNATSKQVIDNLPFACGVAIVSTVSMNMVQGGNLAMGVMFYRLDEGYETDENDIPIQRWSQPCAIGCLAFQIGITYGVGKYEHIFIFKDPKFMETFASFVVVFFCVGSTIGFISFCFV